MTHHQYFLKTVLPDLPGQTVSAFLEKYPEVSLTPDVHMYPLHEASILMLVALTGTGKSTTLEHLDALRQSDELNYQEIIPARRDIADFIIIPTAQKLLGEPIQPVKDRIRRFFYTRTFAEHIPGSMAAAYSWLYVSASNQTPIISEGIRGNDEISYSLEHCPGCCVVELTVNPVIRLKRLSNREDEFDRAVGTDDVAFLPDYLQSEVLQAMSQGEITTKALSIIRAEAENYGLEPFSPPKSQIHPRYRCIDTETRSPREVANEVRQVLEAMMQHATD